MNANVLIGTPCNGDVKADYTLCLLQMVLTSLSYRGDDMTIDLGMQFTKGSILPKSREHIADAAVNGEATHLLFIDSDMVFPPDTLIRLLQHRRPVVACNCPVKTLPVKPTAQLCADGRPVGLNQRDVLCVKRPHYIKQVWRVGTGIMLIEVDVLKKMKRPRFPITFDEKEQEYVGEDWGFCSNLDNLGIEILVDFDLSQDIGHIGDLTYSHDMDGR